MVSPGNEDAVRGGPGRATGMPLYSTRARRGEALAPLVESA